MAREPLEETKDFIINSLPDSADRKIILPILTEAIDKVGSETNLGRNLDWIYSLFNNKEKITIIKDESFSDLSNTVQEYKDELEEELLSFLSENFTVEESIKICQTISNPLFIDKLMDRF